LLAPPLREPLLARRLNFGLSRGSLVLCTHEGREHHRRSGTPHSPIQALSGGGPGALVVAAVSGGRVTRLGIASGAGPYQLVPAAVDDDDPSALGLLPDDPVAAAAAFAAGFEQLAELSREPGSAGCCRRSRNVCAHVTVSCGTST